MFNIIITLSDQQKGVLDDLFSGTMSVKEVLEKRQVDRTEYSRWLEDDLFVLEFNRMLELLHLESRLVLARYSSQIAARMISLAMEEDSEISRQACMGVINHPHFKADKIDQQKEKKKEDLTTQLPPEVASKLLTALTEDEELSAWSKSRHAKSAHPSPNI
jgi:hypothetical protein